jgi:hypothetical protein
MLNSASFTTADLTDFVYHASFFLLLGTPRNFQHSKVFSHLDAVVSADELFPSVYPNRI